MQQLALDFDAVPAPPAPRPAPEPPPEPREAAGEPRSNGHGPGVSERPGGNGAAEALAPAEEEGLPHDDGEPATDVPRVRGAKIARAAMVWVNRLRAGKRVHARTVARDVMDPVFGTMEWSRRDAEQAGEIVVALRLMDETRENAVMWPGTAEMLQRTALEGIAQGVRDTEQIRYQQFTTPLEMAWAVAACAHVEHGQRVLEPSAGTGMLAHAVLALEPGARMVLNELEPVRAAVLCEIFGREKVSQRDAVSLRHWEPGSRGVDRVVMNPPFSRRRGEARRHMGTDAEHVAAALRSLRPGGRLVCITGANTTPWSGRWRGLRAQAPTHRVVATARCAGKLYQRQGTTFATRITVIDAEGGPDAEGEERIEDVAKLLAWAFRVPKPSDADPGQPEPGEPAAERTRSPKPKPEEEVGEPGPPEPEPPEEEAQPPRDEAAEEAEPAPLQAGPEPEPPLLAPRAAPAPRADASHDPDAIYLPWRVGPIRYSDGRRHPGNLMESHAMGMVEPPQSGYEPWLDAGLVASGTLSEAQLESVVLAGAAHAGHFACKIAFGSDGTRAVADGAEGGMSRTLRLRRGWMLGDGTGAGKGRQIAAILLDAWNRGRRRGLWLSQTPMLIADAKRDWEAVGGRPEQIIRMQGVPASKPLEHKEGVLFATYATLRSKAGAGRSRSASRLEQIVRWLSEGKGTGAERAFDGCIIFDEAHAMAGAMGSKGSRGYSKPSLQGLVGLELQTRLPDAKVVYSSATGATRVESLAYAERLGLWGGPDTPFETRAQFVKSMHEGGIAAMEVVSRDCKALGIYQSRVLGFEGVEVDPLVHTLDAEQSRIWDTYATAFEIMHNHLDDALQAAQVVSPVEERTGKSRSWNTQAKSAALSAFEATKLRFFTHLLGAAKCPTLFEAIDADLREGRAAVIQLTSTGEALMERRLADPSNLDGKDVRTGATPREYVFDYLRGAFPTQAYETETTGSGETVSKPLFHPDGRPVQCMEAVQARDRLLEQLATLPELPAALDQILWRYGADAVAEVTGRSRRVERVWDAKEKRERHEVRRRGGDVNNEEAKAFQDDRKQILVFSLAGGIGASYHASTQCANQRRRVHYLLEPGWRADTAVQGLGRTHRTDQSSAPVFRPVSTNVGGERRLIATIARRLDALGALTRGQADSQREMGGRGHRLFEERDNLESPWGRQGLRDFYRALMETGIGGWTMKRFQERTGLDLTDGHGQPVRETPPMSQTLNRVLALRIEDQGTFFEALEERIDAVVEDARASGTYGQGVEVLPAKRMRVVSRIPIEGTSGTAELLTVERTIATEIRTVEDARRLLGEDLLRVQVINAHSRNGAVMEPGIPRIDEKGQVEPTIRLIHPGRVEVRARRHMGVWREQPRDVPDQEWDAKWEKAWRAEVEDLGTEETTRIWMATGRLLPIWTRVPGSEPRMRRATADDGERLIGRLLDWDEAASLDASAIKGLETEQLYMALRRGDHKAVLANAWTLRKGERLYRTVLLIEGPWTAEAVRALGGDVSVNRHHPEASILGYQTFCNVVARHPVVDVRNLPRAAGGGQEGNGAQAPGGR